MKRLIMSGICFMGFIFIFASCAHHTKISEKNLDPAVLYPMYNTKITDFKSQSKCLSPPTVRIINTETRNEDIRIGNIGALEVYIKPKELTSHIVDYMSDAFEKCQVKVDASSTKAINVSIETALKLGKEGSYGPRGVFIHLNIDIPEKHYSNIYSAEEWSPQSIETTMAYAIHLATWKFIDDQVIQNYILCKSG